MIAYDFDGTICEEKKVDFNTMSYKEIVSIRMSCSLLRKPEPGAIIITARPIEDKEHTENWLNSYGIYCPVYYIGKIPVDSIEDICKSKLSKIKELGVTTYYEDNEFVANFLKRNNINVIKV